MLADVFLPCTVAKKKKKFLSDLKRKKKVLSDLKRSQPRALLLRGREVGGSFGG